MRSSLLVMALAAAGCFAPKYQNGNLHCAPDKSCPDGDHCAVDGTCWLNGQDPTFGTPDLAQPGGQPDLAVTADLAAMPDLQGPIDLAIPDGNHLGHVITANGGGVNLKTASSHQLTISVGQKLSGSTSGASHKIQFGVLRGTVSQ
jgi:hypothetical protein